MPSLTTALAEQGLDFVPLLAPTSTPARIDVAAAAASGFVYYVSLTGITGTHLSDMEEPRAKVAAIKARTGGKLPVAVGFGIRTPGAARGGRQLRRRRRRRQRRRRDRREGGRRRARSGAGSGGVRPLAARRARRTLIDYASIAVQLVDTRPPPVPNSVRARPTLRSMVSSTIDVFSPLDL